MEKLKIYYIICFIFQVISMPLLVLLLYLMSITVIYQDLYCHIVVQKVDDNFKKEFKKIFPDEYTCQDTTLAGMGLYLMFLLICFILFCILISYNLVFCFKMRNNGFRENFCELCVFINSIIFLLAIGVYYIYLIPTKTSFDNPDIIFIFNDNLNKKIEENLEKLVIRRICGIFGLLLIVGIIATTLIKIKILSLTNKKGKIDEQLLSINSNEPIISKN